MAYFVECFLTNTSCIRVRSDFFLFKILQVDDSSFDDGGSGELPDGLANFRMSLAELLVEICHFLGSAAYLQKVPERIFVYYLHNCHNCVNW